MPVYRATIKGAKPFLVRAESAAKAKDKIIDLDPLNSDEMADALEEGEKIFGVGDSIVLEAPRAQPPVSEELGAERVNVETGMIEARTVGGSGYQDSRPATLDELRAESTGEWRTDPASGMVQRQPHGADSEHWEDIRAATDAELEEAGPPAAVAAAEAPKKK